ncbi:hypothetical protein L6452_23270 [Arctium lappa]|uniref:Uncharacterized protein n=1 Tax=Arctium lappa TaxID=4217 RepID=A0ACB9B0V5_ARCLA|nr:hypothetical protein L6452_23270 [Arctium lappa]
MILISSTFLFLTLSKHKVQVLEKENQHLLLTSYHNNSNQVENEAKIGFLDMGSPESCSENQIIGRISPTSEQDSDGFISDEEGLIEIQLPTGNYVQQKRQEQEFLPEVSIYRWSEMNEEENLIEIDISMGSIKCTTF